MGDYTARLAPEDFESLKARADRRELFFLPDIDGYFDDERHYQDIRALCGFTHPVMETTGGRNAPKFNNFGALKRHVETTFNQFFCDVCVKGRKVFVSEQLLYSKDGLRRHQDSGDTEGPLAESGFKGHPACKFCRTRFYDSNELYRHMEGSHEHCFLCRRAAPDKYVYYRHYKELEDHFTKDHHPCPHPACLERKFVVFNTDYELKAHFAAEHGDEMKMTGAQRRQALTIPLQLQFRSRDDEETEPGPSARLERAAVVIGGGHNIGSRAARNGRSGAGGGGAGHGGGLHHVRSEPQMAQDASADVSSVTFTAEDFPAPGESSAQGGAGPLGRWAAFAGAQGSAGGLSDQDFPALPSLSRNQRRRIKEQQRSLADRLSAAAQPPRVLNRATPVPSSSGAAGGAGPSTSSAAPPDAADFPALQAFAPAPASAAAPSTSAPAPAPAASSAASARAAGVVAPVSANRRPPGMGRDEFPALGGGAKSRPAPVPASPPPASAAYSGVTGGWEAPAAPSGLTQSDVLSSLFMRPGSAAATLAPNTGTAGAGPSAPPESLQPPNAEDFPSLPPGSKPVGRSRASMGKGNIKVISAKGTPPKASPGKAMAAAPATLPQGGGAAAAAASVAASTSGSGSGPGGGVSNSLKAANKALVERVKRQLSGTAFDSFRQQSLSFMRGELAADEYHDYMVSLGLLSLVAELVSLCPDASKRRLLLDVHRAVISSPAAQDPGLVGAGWMPPEVAAAKALRVAQHSAWGCPRCSLCNAPDDARCESCGASRPSEAEQAASAAPVVLAPSPYSSYAARQAPTPAPAPAAASASASGRPAAPLAPAAPPAPADFPSLPSGTGRARAPPPPPPSDFMRADSGGAEDWGASTSSSAGGKGKKNKGTTIKIGLPTSGGGGGSRPHPQNVWTQPAFKAKTANQWSGQGGGKLAKMHGAINDAWE